MPVHGKITKIQAALVVLAGLVMVGPLGGAGAGLWANGFLPSVQQGIQLRPTDDPVLFLTAC